MASPARRRLSRAAAELDPRLRDQAARLAALESEVSDVADEIRRYSELLDSDPNRLEALESRLAVLDTIKRKYGGTLEAAIAERARLESQIGATQDLDSAVAAAEKDRDARRRELESAAATSDRRHARAAAKRMQEAVAAELQGLRLEGARFEIELRAAAGDRAKRGRVGRDDVLGQPRRADRAAGARRLGRRARALDARDQDGGR